jgi:UDP-glucose 4-epimerase
MERNALVTGGAGFLGRNASEALARRGFRVTVLDDLSSPGSTFDSPQLSAPEIRCVQGSTRDAALVRALVAEHPVVLHFASVVGVERTISNTLSTMRNLEGTLHLVEALTPGHAVVFTSSADVYGLHSHHYGRPMAEDDHHVLETSEVNRWVYARVKALEENAVYHGAASNVVVRVFNCYGPGMDFPDARRVIPQLIENALRRTPMRISGDGSQRRSYCHVDDMVRGLLSALELAMRGRTAEIVNLGNPETFTVAETAHVVNRIAVELGILDAPVPLELGSGLYSQRFDDSWNRVPDIGRAREKLGFAPVIPFEAGLRDTLAWYARLAAGAGRA